MTHDSLAALAVLTFAAAIVIPSALATVALVATFGAVPVAVGLLTFAVLLQMEATR